MSAKWMITTRVVESHGPGTYNAYPSGTACLLNKDCGEHRYVEFPGGRVVYVESGAVLPYPKDV